MKHLLTVLLRSSPWPAKPADATTFWRTAYGLGYTQEAAKGCIVQAGGDWGRALAMLNGGAR